MIRSMQHYQAAVQTLVHSRLCEDSRRISKLLGKIVLPLLDGTVKLSVLALPRFHVGQRCYIYRLLQEFVYAGQQTKNLYIIRERAQIFWSIHA